jgi:hypothetical protein
MILKQLCVFVHVLCMLGAFGGLLMIQFGLPREVRDSSETASVAGRLASMLIGVGFIAGFIIYWLNIQYAANNHEHLPGLEHSIVGIKFLLLIAAGGFMGLTSRYMKAQQPGKAGIYRGMSMVVMAIAALLGLSI